MSQTSLSESQTLLHSACIFTNIYVIQLASSNFSQIWIFASVITQQLQHAEPVSTHKTPTGIGKKKTPPTTKLLGSLRCTKGDSSRRSWTELRPPLTEWGPHLGGSWWHWAPVSWTGGVPLGGDPRVDPGHTRVTATRLAWECLEILPEELDVRVSLKMDGWINWVRFRVLLTSSRVGLRQWADPEKQKAVTRLHGTRNRHQVLNRWETAHYKRKEDSNKR